MGCQNSRVAPSGVPQKKKERPIDRVFQRLSSYLSIGKSPHNTGWRSDEKTSQVWKVNRKADICLPQAWQAEDTPPVHTTKEGKVETVQAEITTTVQDFTISSDGESDNELIVERLKAPTPAIKAAALPSQTPLPNNVIFGFLKLRDAHSGEHANDVPKPASQTALQDVTKIRRRRPRQGHSQPSYTRAAYRTARYKITINRKQPMTGIALTDSKTRTPTKVDGPLITREQMTYHKAAWSLTPISLQGPEPKPLPPRVPLRQSSKLPPIRISKPLPPVNLYRKIPAPVGIATVASSCGSGPSHSEPKKISELTTLYEVTQTLGSTVRYPAVHPKVYPGQADVHTTETSQTYPIIQSRESRRN